MLKAMQLQAPPGSNTKAIIHPGKTATTQYHQQSQTTIITTTTTQDHHQHLPVLGALQTSPSSVMTFLDESRQQAKLIEYRKELLANVSIFDGKDKKSCLMWVKPVCTHHCQHKNVTQGTVSSKGRTNRIYPGTDLPE